MRYQGKKVSKLSHEGKAVALAAVEQIEKSLFPGAVMVVADTDPDWIPAFEFLAEHGGAIVTEVGGVLCHAAVVCREMKIACVTAVENARNLLAGKIVKVIGPEGVVEIS